MQKSLLEGVSTQLSGHSVWKQPVYNGKNPPTHFFYNPNKS